MDSADSSEEIPPFHLVVLNAVGWVVLLVVMLALPFLLDMEYMGELFQLMYIVLLGAAVLITAFSILCVPVSAAWRLKEVVSRHV